MDRPRCWAIWVLAALTLGVALGLPVGLVSTYPTEPHDGFAGVIQWLLIMLTVPVSLAVALLLAAFLNERPWARWLMAFTFYMVGAIAVRQRLFGGPRNTDFLWFLDLLLAPAVVIVMLLLLPSTALHSGRREWHRCSGRQTSPTSSNTAHR